MSGQDTSRAAVERLAAYIEAGDLFSEGECATAAATLRALTAERDAAWAAGWRAGAEAIRTRAAYDVAELAEHDAEERGWRDGARQARMIAKAIRALPLPDPVPEGGA